MATSIGRKTPPQGVVVTQRLQAAGVRALDAHRRARFMAESVGEELDETTAPHGVPIEVHEEDSMVTTVKEAITTHEERIAASGKS